MNKLMNILKKQGGLKLIKQYIRNGCLFTAIMQFILLGKSRISLEILRLSTQQKTKQKLYKKYKKNLFEFNKNYIEKEHISSNKVWICWFQGIDNAPIIVKECYNSVLNNLKDKEIILITKENIFEYTDFPKYIIEKWNNGSITDTHMTDLLRLELLTKYGGLWLDATVFCSSNNIPSYIFDSELFFYQTLKPRKRWS